MLMSRIGYFFQNCVRLENDFEIIFGIIEYRFG